MCDGSLTIKLGSHHQRNYATHKLYRLLLGTLRTQKWSGASRKMMTREARLNFKCFQMLSRFQIGTAFANCKGFGYIRWSLLKMQVIFFLISKNKSEKDFVIWFDDKINESSTSNVQSWKLLKALEIESGFTSHHLSNSSTSFRGSQRA